MYEPLNPYELYEITGCDRRSRKRDETPGFDEKSKPDKPLYLLKEKYRGVNFDG